MYRDLGIIVVLSFPLSTNLSISMSLHVPYLLIITFLCLLCLSHFSVSLSLLLLTLCSSLSCISVSFSVLLLAPCSSISQIFLIPCISSINFFIALPLSVSLLPSAHLCSFSQHPPYPYLCFIVSTSFHLSLSLPLLTSPNLLFTFPSAHIISVINLVFKILPYLTLCFNQIIFRRES